MSLRILMSCLLAAVALSPLAAQNAEKESKSSSSIVIKKVVSSSDGGTQERSYKRVMKNGRLVEESGDRSLLDDVDVKVDAEDARRGVVRLRKVEDGSSSDRKFDFDVKVDAGSGVGEIPEMLKGLLKNFDVKVHQLGKDGHGMSIVIGGEGVGDIMNLRLDGRALEKGLERLGPIIGEVVEAELQEALPELGDVIENGLREVELEFHRPMRSMEAEIRRALEEAAKDVRPEPKKAERRFQPPVTLPERLRAQREAESMRAEADALRAEIQTLKEQLKRMETKLRRQ